MYKIPSLEEMLKAGLHFGHKNSRRHPKMDPFIFTSRNGINIINLEETAKKLEISLNFIKETAAKGGNILFIGTKPQVLPVVTKYAKECGMLFVNERWLGGTLTNFSVISSLIKRYNELRSQQEKGELKKYTKKEQLVLAKKIEDMARKVGGISGMIKVPDVVFVVDIKQEKTAVMEAVRKGIKIVAICDTNVNPRDIDYVIPANDDAVSSVEMIVGLVAEAVKEGVSQRPAAVNATPAENQTIPVKKEMVAVTTETKTEVKKEIKETKPKRTRKVRKEPASVKTPTGEEENK